MEWEKLLSTTKLLDEEPDPREFISYPINEFEKDYNKIVTSSAFRRLQDKTQVFPLDKSDFVRTRLTHSIEVSTIAKQLGIMISENTTEYRREEVSQAKELSSVLLCAGLLHDLGNPPFGHFGEATIGSWFKENLTKIHYKGSSLRDVLNDQMINDLENFEGNAQSLRILAKAKHNSEINISAAIISTLIKYPTSSTEFDKSSDDIKKHKLGYFFAESEQFFEIANIVETLHQDGEISRHPLAFMLEAADDIAYATADLEDAFKKRLFTLEEFISFFESNYDAALSEQRGRPEYYSCLLIQNLKERCNRQPEQLHDGTNFNQWLTYVRRWLMYVAVYRFSRSYEDIIAGTYKNDLFFATNHSLSIDILKKATRQYAFNSPGILKLELSAQTIISFLLDKFVGAVIYYDYADEAMGYKPSKADQKLMGIFSENYIQDYNNAKTGNEAIDLYYRLLMATDYIRGHSATEKRRKRGSCRGKCGKLTARETEKSGEKACS